LFFFFANLSLWRLSASDIERYLCSIGMAIGNLARMRRLDPVPLCTFGVFLYGSYGVVFMRNALIFSADFYGFFFVPNNNIVIHFCSLLVLRGFKTLNLRRRSRPKTMRYISLPRKF